MKQLSLLSKTFALIIALVVLAIPARADRVVTQQQFGKQTIEVADDEVITFYDMNSYQGISSSSSNNSQSLTVFKPAAGKAIQLNFERLDVRNDGNSWPAYVNVYAGAPALLDIESEGIDMAVDSYGKHRRKDRQEQPCSDYWRHPEGQDPVHQTEYLCRQYNRNRRRHCRERQDSREPPVCQRCWTS
ncbi:MAG: hypothetical protein IKX31_01160 [Muribaculaceae bacterium]|nr:hypothetical protein [Muribaculaceae bacterium]